MTDLAEPHLPVPVAAGFTGAAPPASGGAAGAPGEESFLTPIDYWLAEQQSLTAVERFAQHHATATTADHETRYRDLLPLSAPEPGEQYAFEVDLDSCTGCKACVAACHSLNGLDEDEAFRSVGTLLGGPRADPVIQTVTTACHHCLDPACMTGCPTLAYEKDPETGIVRHLDDQCIGCQYCTLTCPYEVPSYNTRLGIVRKCDMCAGRLAEGEAPACVQSCPTGSIAIRVVSVDEVMAETSRAGAALVPHAPHSAITRPTTRYTTKRSLTDDVTAADHRSVEPAHAHTPLVVTLILTQLAVGMFGLGLLATGSAPIAAVAFFTGVLALGASVLHLGRPQIAWKAVLGLRRSWVSREIVAFGTFAGATAAYALARWIELPGVVVGSLALVALATGVAGVVASVMIYAVTKKRWWAAPRTAVTFGLTTLVTGLGGTAAVLSLAGRLSRPLVVALAAAAAAKLIWDALPLRRARLDGPSPHAPLAATRALLVGPLRSITARRFAFGGLAVLFVLVMVAAGPSTPPAIALVTTALLLAGELFERRLFFLAVSSPRMPGELR
ncbi:MAG: dimethyl sulfoxide reductase anchor subunit [Actinobacteria bacterium]|nr:dimethyl sulfoxide reductase anchor subunit [Actinomycetota bacterium]